MALVRLLEITVPSSLIAVVRDATQRGMRNFERQVLPMMRQALRDYMQTLAIAAVNDARKRGRLQAHRGVRIEQFLVQGIRIHGTRLNSLRGFYTVPEWVAKLEFGGDILGKPYLTVPIHFGLRPDGRPKQPSAGRWRAFKTFVYTSRRTGKKYIAYRDRRVERLRILYILLEKVHIKQNTIGIRDMASATIHILGDAWGDILATTFSANALQWMQSGKGDAGLKRFTIVRLAFRGFR